MRYKHDNDIGRLEPNDCRCGGTVGYTCSCTGNTGPEPGYDELHADPKPRKKADPPDGTEKIDRVEYYCKQCKDIVDSQYFVLGSKICNHCRMGY